ncbi:MAG: ATP-binding protein [Bacteroidota bacterium]
MHHPLIGRQEEQGILQRALDSKEAEMVALIGRRRVGKTFLIKSFFKDKIAFEITGIQNAPQEEQLQNFTQQLNRAAQNTLPLPRPNNWLEAFHLLTLFLEKKDKKEKLVLFFDELPWLAAQRSSFLRAFGNFWNSWAVNQSIVVVICGSAASWMIQKVVHNTGGLYNRITRRIFLQAFTLSEVENYLQSRQIYLDRYQIVQLYMALGGIPHHLKEIEANKSAVQNINRICFSPNGLLRDEFDQLYPALFANADNHLKVIRTLAQKRQGISREELIRISRLPNGGGLTKVLEELSQSGFIQILPAFGKKKKGQIYRLTDEYSLFYLRFIEGSAYEGDNTWLLLSQTQSNKIWSGYAFENICLKHVAQLKKALGISGIYSNSSSFYQQGTKEESGAQIDLLIDRNDHVINVYEIKLYQEPFSISKDYAANLRNKIGTFRQASRTKKHLIPTLISPFGLKANSHSRSLNIQVLTLDALFD